MGRKRTTRVNLSTQEGANLFASALRSGNITMKGPGGVVKVRQSTRRTKAGVSVVRAHTRSASMMTRGTRSKLARKAGLLGLTKARMVAGHAYGHFKAAQKAYAEHGGSANLLKMHRKQRRYLLLRGRAGY